MKILICDDMTDRAETWRDELVAARPEDQVVALSRDEILGSLSTLHARRGAIRAGIGPPAGNTPLDEADVLVLDYDLKDLRTEGEFVTGAELAYAARVFSDARSIVLMNQFGPDRFDLTLVEDRASRSDWNIGSEHLTAAGLWKGGDFEGFRPWHWPNLALEPDDFRACVDDALANLDTNVLAFFGFEEEDIARLSAPALAALESVDAATRAPTAAKDVTLRQFALGAQYGLERRDAENPGHIPAATLARVAASGLRRWLHRFVLVAQSPLVDVPHLVERLPSVFQGVTADIGTWNRYARLRAPDLHSLAPFAFSRGRWLSRDAFWWTRLAADETLIAEAQERLEDLPAYVFLEDESRFATPDDAREFRSDVGGVFHRRHVAGTPSRGAVYVPLSYLAD